MLAELFIFILREMFNLLIKVELFSQKLCLNYLAGTIILVLVGDLRLELPQTSHSHRWPHLFYKMCSCKTLLMAEVGRDECKPVWWITEGISKVLVLSLILWRNSFD